jgi:3-deoxy-D-manno-octulosonic-acid transferase
VARASLWLYRVVLWALLPIVAPWLKLRQWMTGKSRPGVRARSGRELPRMTPGGVWIQAVSVGEVEVARRLLAELDCRAPELPVVVSATTATGLALAQRSIGDRWTVIPCPLDLPGPVQRVLDAADPRLLVLVETELWPEMLHQAARRGVPVAVVNARLSERSFAAYRRVRRPLRSLLAPVTRVLARSPADADRFAALGVAPDRIAVCGNVKYDLDPDRRPLPWATDVQRVAGQRPIVVAGSTMDGEEDQVLEALCGLSVEGGAPLIVLAPRHPERFDAVARQIEERGLVVARRSRDGELREDTQVFLLDTIGELARAYGLARLAFIGGSLVPTGGHNPLEPAVWGVPVLSGPRVHNFREVYDEMTAAGGACLVEDAAELREAASTWLLDAVAAKAAGEAGRSVVERNRGATEHTVRILLELMGGL